MERSVEIIRLEINGRWSAEEFGQALVSISDLYDLRLYLELLLEEQLEWERFYAERIHFPPFRSRGGSRFIYWGFFPWLARFPAGVPPVLGEADLSRLSQLLEPEERLEVRRISYGSPGTADLAGIGAVIGHIKDFILKLIERRDLQRHQELSDERAALENDRLRLENARTFVALGRDLGYTDTDLRRMVAYVDGKQEPHAPH